MLKNHASTLALAAVIAAGAAGVTSAQTTEEAPAEGEAEVIVEEAPEAEVIVEEAEGEPEVIVEEGAAEDEAVVVEDEAVVADPAEEVEDATGEEAVVVEDVEVEGDATPEEGEAVVVEEVEAETEEVEVEVEEVEVEQPVEGQIFEQSPEEVLGSTLMDATVMSPDGETVGDVEDVIVSADGQISGVVIGVGGFLGIGEKRVALEYEQIQVQQGEAGEMTFMTSVTQEQLENAPEFVTQEEAAAMAPAEGDTAVGTEAVVDTEEPAVEGDTVVIEE